MANKIKASDIADFESIRKEADLLAESLGNISKQQNEIIKSSSKGAASLKNSAAALNENDKATKQLSETNKQLEAVARKNTAAWKEQIALENQLISTKKRNELATEGTNRELAKQRLLLAEQNKAVKQEAQNQLGLVSVYQKVQNKLNALGKEYSDLSIRKNLGAKLTDEETKRYDFLEKKITVYDNALKLTDANQGKHQRKVGNYTGSFNALNNSVNQLSREMPAFANSMNTGFMAISNNIPAFFDALQGIKSKNIELAKSGQPTKSMLGELGGALFSVQSLMSVGVTLLTIYGAKLVDWGVSAMKASNGLSSLSENQKELNSSMVENSGQYIKEKVNIDVLYKTATNLNASYKERKEAVDDLQKQYPFYFKNLSDETILAGDAEKQYLALSGAILTAAKARAATEILQKRETERLVTEQSGLEKIKDLYKDLNNAKATNSSLGGTPASSTSSKTKEEVKAEIASRIQFERHEMLVNREKWAKEDAFFVKTIMEGNIIEKTLDGEKAEKKPKKQKPEKKLQDITDTTFELEKQRLERIIAINNEIVSNSELTDEKRLYSLELSENAQIELIKKSKENQLNQTKEAYEKEKKEGNKTKDGLVQLEENYVADKKKINEKSFNDISDVEKKSIDEVSKIKKQAIAKSISDQLEIAKKGLKEREIAENESLADIAEKYKIGKISYQDAEDQRTKIKEAGVKERKKLEQDSLQSIIDNLENLSKLNLLNPDQLKLFDELRLKLAELKAELGKPIEGGGMMADLKKWVGKNQEMIEASMGALNALAGIGKQESDNKIAQLEDEKNATTAKYAREIELAGDNQKEIKKIELKKQIETEALDKKARKIKHDQAVKDKEIALVNATIAAALSVVKASPVVPLMILAGIAGAAAIATIAMQKIPAYAKGTQSAKGGLSVVGEEGQELVTTPSGKQFLTPKSASFINLEKGSRVNTARETMAILANQKQPVNINVDPKEDVSIIFDELGVRKLTSRKGFLETRYGI